MAIHRDIFLAALEFTSLSMLSWLAAAAVPWLLHRWFRRPQRTQPWAAVDLLLAQGRAALVHLGSPENHHFYSHHPGDPGGQRAGQVAGGVPESRIRATLWLTASLESGPKRPRGC